MPLMAEIADLQNLMLAFRHCRKGKKRSCAYDHFLLAMPESLLEIGERLTAGHFRWLPYYEMTVCDPKRRQILVAPFADRVAHQAIAQIIGPLIDKAIPTNSYACRAGMGNQKATLALREELGRLGPERFTIKLDVRQYFLSIHHEILLSKLSHLIPCHKTQQLLEGLLRSHPPFHAQGRGLAIGNVTSQLFANLYLASIDAWAAAQPGLAYFRYMDDMIVTGPNKNLVLDAGWRIVEHAKALALDIPHYKMMPIGRDPVPFLGFLVAQDGIKPLRRNIRRFDRRVRKLTRAGLRLSKLEQIKTSFEAWKALGS